MAGSSKLCHARQVAPKSVISGHATGRLSCAHWTLHTQPAKRSTASRFHLMSRKLPGEAVGVQQRFRGPAAGQAPQAVGGGEHEHQDVLTPGGSPQGLHHLPCQHQAFSPAWNWDHGHRAGSGSCEQLQPGAVALLGSRHLCSTWCACSCESADCARMVAARQVTGAWCTLHSNCPTAPGFIL